MNALHPAIQAALAPFVPPPVEQCVPPLSFNDDDFYVYDAKTKELVRSIGCKSVDLFIVRTYGLEVKEGQTWGRGQSVKRMGLWRAA